VYVRQSLVQVSLSLQTNVCCVFNSSQHSLFKSLLVISKKTTVESRFFSSPQEKRRFIRKIGDELQTPEVKLKYLIGWGEGGGNDFWFQLSGDLKSREFKKSGFHCNCFSFLKTITCDRDELDEYQFKSNQRAICLN